MYIQILHNMYSYEHIVLIQQHSGHLRHTDDGRAQWVRFATYNALQGLNDLRSGRGVGRTDWKLAAMAFSQYHIYIYIYKG